MGNQIEYWNQYYSAKLANIRGNSALLSLTKSFARRIHEYSASDAVSALDNFTDAAALHFPRNAPKLQRIIFREIDRLLNPNPQQDIEEPQLEFDSFTWTGFKTISELKPDKICWLWRPFLARKLISLFWAPPKAGKTTLLSILFREAISGGSIGNPVEPCRFGIITEEHESIWAERYRDLNLSDLNLSLYSMPFKRRPDLDDWHSYNDLVAQWVEDESIDVLIYDTIAGFWANEDENDATSTLDSIRPLRKICESGAAVMIVHHAGKARRATIGTSSRGSSALTAAVDTLIELSCTSSVVTSRKRRLHAHGRLGIEEMYIELSEDSTRYNLIKSIKDDPEESQTHTVTPLIENREARVTAYHDLLPNCAPGLSAKELLGVWPDSLSDLRPGFSTIIRDAELLSWNTTGKGAKGDPIRYYRENGV